MSSVVSYGACLPGAQVRRSGYRLRGLQNSFATMTAIGALMLLPRPALAGPTGGTVVAGSAAIQQSGTTTNINQSSNSAVINWQGFSIGARETVNFNQPSAASATLNRVIGNETSVIDGALNANGQVFIVNSAGVLFGKGSQVNVGGLVASTLDISNANFMAGRYIFSGSSNASVTNSGTIHASPGGYVSLLGKTVANDGVISANLGTVAMASGQQITLNFGGNSLVDVTIDKGALNALVSNKRAIIANGGQVIMTARAADEVLSAQVNNSGVIQARTMAALQGGGSGTRVVHKGKIKLLAQGGAVNVSGKLDASAPKGGDGGFIETSGDKVQVADNTVVTTKAASGTSGTWLIDPTDFNIIAGSGAQTASGIGATTLSNSLDSNNVVITTAASGNGKGDINVNAAVGWSANTGLTLNAANNINVNAPITIHGASAGLVLNYGGDYNIRTPASYSGTVLAANGQPVAKQDTSGGVYGSITFDNAANINGLVINGQSYDLIYSMADLAGITGSNVHYALVQDLDAASWSTSNAGSASVVASLNGALAGLGHKVSNLDISTTLPDAGLIGQTAQGSLVRDLGVVNVKVSTTDQFAGGLIGQNLGDVRGTYSTGDSSSLVSAGSGGAGGLIGLNGVIPNFNPLPVNTISDSFSTVAVSGSASGGLIGRAQYANILRTDATGQISSTGTSGGLLGLGLTTNISDSYATGAVTGVITGTAPNLSSSTSTLGGLVGSLDGDYLRNSFATGEVRGGWTLGGLVGTIDYYPFTVDNSYASGNVTSYRTASLPSSRAGIGGLIGYVGGDQLLYSDTVSILNSHASGAVTFTGTFGNGAGGLIGEMAGAARIDNSYASGDVKGSVNGTGVGGLVGFGDAIEISNSHATGAVSGKTSVGGLIGAIGAVGGSISNSYATGNVRGSGWSVGGLAGINGGGSTITGSYATGSVTGTGVANPNGGVGSFAGTNIGSIADLYATGAVAGPGTSTGGFVGISFGYGNTITNSYFNSAVNPGFGMGSTGYLDPIIGGGGLTGQQLADIKFYANGTINQVLADRAVAAEAQAALAQRASSTANVIATTDAQTSALTPPTSTLATAGTKAVDAVAPPAVEDNLQNIESNIREEERHHHRRLATTGSHHQGNGHRGGNFGATIRAIDVDGQRFDLRNNAPKTDAPAQTHH